MKGDERRGRVHSFRSLEGTGLSILVKSPLKHKGWKQRLYLAHNLETRNMGKFLPDSLSLIHAVLAGAAETREPIPRGFLHSISGASALPGLSLHGTSYLRPLQEPCYSPKWHTWRLASPRASLDPGFKIPDDSLEVTEHYFYQFLSHKVLRPAQIQREQSQRISAIWSLLQSPWIAFCILLWIQREATGGFKYRNSRMLFLFLKDHLAAREYIEWGQDRKQGDKLATSMVVWMAAVEQEKSGD